MARRGRGVRIAVLVEDQSLRRFASEVLLLLGFQRHDIRVIPYPVGQGSAKHWVEKQYPAEVRAYRKKANSQKIALLVGTEADQQIVKYRLDCLASSLTDANVSDRGAKERIVCWIPKWNIETWILHLSGQKVDEQSNLKNQVKKKPDYPAVAKAFVNSFRESPGERSATLPSLDVAFEETRRLNS